MTHRRVHGTAFGSLLQSLLVLATPALSCASAITCSYGVCDLGNLGAISASNIGSNAMYINNNGQVAGIAYVSGSTSSTFLYTPNADPLTGGNTLDLEYGTSYSGFNSYPTGLSSQGDVSGTINTSTGANAFLYNGSLTDLGTLGGQISFGGGVNDSGQVVGFSSTGSQTPVFYWNGSTMKSLGTLGGTSAKFYEYINNNGQISGNSDIAGTDEAFYAANSSSSLVAITLGAAGSSSTAKAMNANGQVVGTSATSTNSYQQAFIYSGGSPVNMGTQWSQAETYVGNSDALAVNDAGVAVGQADVSSTNSHAVMFSLNALSQYVMTDLGTLDYGAGNSSADAINDKGWIVGTSTNTTGGTDPFLDISGQMIDLNSPSILNGTGFTSFISATAVNDSGWIIGQGITNSGATDGYILMYNSTAAATPEPSTILSTALGALLCWLVARKGFSSVS